MNTSSCGYAVIVRRIGAVLAFTTPLAHTPFAHAQTAAGARALAAPPPRAATWLPLDTLFAPAERVGCEGISSLTATPGRITAADATAARAAWRDAQDALLEGNRSLARGRLEEVVRADPHDTRAWLELANVLEHVGDSTAARSAACRVLALTTASALQREDAQRRWERLLTREIAGQLALASRRHADGVRFARRGDWTAARRAFDEVVRVMPGASSAWRNRAIVSAEVGDRLMARRDLERYVQIGAAPGERLVLARALSALQRPRYAPGTAAVAGLIPGGAQFVTGRPAAGALVLSAVVGSGVLAFTSRTRERTIPFLDPNGEPAPYTERYQVQPYRTAAIAAGATVLVGALFEGVLYARRSGRLPQLTASVGPAAGSMGVQLSWSRFGGLQGVPDTGR